MNFTQNQIDRVTKDFTKIAGEAVTVEVIGGTVLYAFCSELGTLRIFRKMSYMRQGYSENLKSFYVSLDVYLIDPKTLKEGN